jgi:hypothetical protein
VKGRYIVRYRIVSGTLLILAIQLAVHAPDWPGGAQFVAQLVVGAAVAAFVMRVSPSREEA